MVLQVSPWSALVLAVLCGVLLLAYRGYAQLVPAARQPAPGLRVQPAAGADPLVGGPAGHRPQRGQGRAQRAARSPCGWSASGRCRSSWTATGGVDPAAAGAGRPGRGPGPRQPVGCPALRPQGGGRPGRPRCPGDHRRPAALRSGRARASRVLRSAELDVPVHRRGRAGRGHPGDPADGGDREPGSGRAAAARGVPRPADRAADPGQAGPAPRRGDRGRVRRGRRGRPGPARPGPVQGGQRLARAHLGRRAAGPGRPAAEPQLAGGRDGRPGRRGRVRGGRPGARGERGGRAGRGAARGGLHVVPAGRADRSTRRRPSASRWPPTTATTARP